MGYSRLGGSGLVVSSLALGVPNFGTPLPQMAVNPHFDEKAGSELVAAALDHGINFIDTADLYSRGEAEEILGRALGRRRRNIVLATKVGLRTGDAMTAAGLSRRHIMMSVDDSLRRLATDWIDLYIVHKPDPHTPLEETLRALDDIVRAGKVRYIGYSNWPSWMAAKAIGLQERYGWAKFVAAQLHYALTGRELEHEDLPFLRDAGIGLIAWSPLAQGYLTGKYTDEDPSGGGGRLSKFSFGPFDRSRGDAVVKVLRHIAQRDGATPAKVALSWVIGRSGVSSALLGVTSIAQLLANINANDTGLSEADIEMLDSASRPPASYPGWYNDLMDDPVVRSAITPRKIGQCR